MQVFTDLLDSEASTSDDTGSTSCVQCKRTRKQISKLSEELQAVKKAKATLEDELTNALQMISHLKGNQINVHVLSWLITLVIHRLGEVPES